MSHLTVGKAVCGDIAAALVALVLVQNPSRADTKTVPVLHIGTTEAVVEENTPEGSDDALAEVTYRRFVREVTGFGSDFVTLENQEVLTERLASGRLQLGVFMGYEFAWAQARHPKLKVLVVGVNHYSYQYPALVVRRDSPARDLADLKGTTLALPRRGQGYGRLFLAAQSRLARQDPGIFLDHIDNFEEVETPLDDVVDGTRQAAVVDRRGLEAYQSRKPGRFARLKTLSESPPMPATLIAYYDGQLDPQTVTRLRDGFSNAHKQARGELFLMLFGLTRYALPSDAFERVLAETRQTYPAPALRRRTEAPPESDLEDRPSFPLEPVLIAARSSPGKEPRPGGFEYYVCIFAYETDPRRARYSHTFATFIRSGGGSVEVHTISWLPKSGNVEVARTQCESGCARICAPE